MEGGSSEMSSECSGSQLQLKVVTRKRKKRKKKKEQLTDQIIAMVVLSLAIHLLPSTEIEPTTPNH